MTRQHNWTAGESALLDRLHREGASAEVLFAAFPGRTPDAVRSRLTRLGRSQKGLCAGLYNPRPRTRRPPPVPVPPSPDDPPAPAPPSVSPALLEACRLVRRSGPQPLAWLTLALCLDWTDLEASGLLELSCRKAWLTAAGQRLLDQIDKGQRNDSDE